MLLSAQKIFKYLFQVFFCLFFGGISIFAQSLKYKSDLIRNSDWNFVENKGQVQSSDIKFYGNQGGVYLYCQPGKISFVFTKSEPKTKDVSEATGMDTESPFTKGAGGFDPLKRKFSESSKTTINRADLILLNCNPSAQILASDQQEYYENYYTSGNANEGITRVHTFKTITYKEIYPHIDMILHSHKEGMKYEFMVHPGGKVSDIQMKWEGIEKIKKLKDLKIEYTFALGKIDESRPLSFQDGKEIKSDFVNKGNLIGFNLNKFDKSKDLLIDPTLVWGSYFGGSSEEWGEGVATDQSGNVFITGSTISSSGIVAKKAYQKYYAGNGTYDYFGDVYLAKFNNIGKILWATYYGGSMADIGYAVATDKNGSVYMTGSTESKSGIATNGAFQTQIHTGENIFLSKFNGAGALQWGTYIAGDGEGHGVTSDTSGNIFIAGYTQESGNATNGAYQAANGGQDAFIAAFDNTGNREWATYFGGSGYEYGSGIACDLNGNIVIAGMTSSTTGISSNGAYQTSLCGGGNEDGFLVKFSGSGDRLWSTYYGGVKNDIFNCIAIDHSGNICAAGYTESNSGIATPGSYDSVFRGYSYNGDGFVVLFDSTGYPSWGTYYGGGYSSPVTAVTFDSLGEIYVEGNLSRSLLSTTSDGYQTKYGGGNSDAFIARFSLTGSPQWASYYGGKSDDGCSGLAAGSANSVYMAGNTQSSDGISTDGSFQSSYAGNEDAFLVKFGHIPAFDVGIRNTLNPRGLFCSDTENVQVQVKNYGSSEVDSMTIKWITHSKLQPAYHWKGKLLPDSVITVTLGRLYYGPGLDTVISWTSMPDGQIDSATWNDSNIETLNILPGTSVHIGKNKAICEYDSTIINSYLDVGDTCIWTSNPTGFNSGIHNPVVSPMQTTKYYLTEISKSTSCRKTDSLTVIVHPAPPGIASHDTTVCSKLSFTIHAKPFNNAIYLWSSDPAGIGSGNPDISTKLDQSTTFQLIEIDTIYGCTAKDSIYIKVEQSPTLYAGKDSSICIGNSVALIATPDTLKNYYWKNLTSGFTSFSRSTTDNPQSTTTYYITAANNIGCSAIDSVKITVNPNPVANVGGNQTICAGKKIAIGELSKPGLKYSWSSIPAGFNDIASSAIVDPAATTRYFLNVTNMYGCRDKDSATITVNPIPYVYSGSSRSICVGDQVSIGRGGISGLIYNWSSKPPGFSSTLSGSTVMPMQTTIYKLTETNIYGCHNDDSVTITVNPLPAADVGPVGRICSGTAATIGAKKVTGSRYFWSSLPQGFSSNLSETTVTPNKTTIYILEEISDSGCIKRDSVKIIVVPTPIADAGSNQTVCAGTQVSIGAPPDSGNSYQWVSFPMGFSCFSSDSIVTPDTTTSYILFESGPNGCGSRAYITVTVNPNPSANWTIKSICDTVSFIPENDSNKHYSWYFGDGDSDISNALPVHIYKSMGNDHVALITSDSFGCTSTKDSIISIDCTNPQYQDSSFDLQFYPNPFHGSATLHYLLNKTSHVRIDLYDAIGKQVSIVEDRTLEKGVYTTEINSHYLHLTNGVYFLIFRSDNGSETLKIISL